MFRASSWDSIRSALWPFKTWQMERMKTARLVRHNMKVVCSLFQNAGKHLNICVWVSNVQPRMFNFTGLRATLRSLPPHWEHNIVNCAYLPSSVRLNFTRLIGQTGFALHKKKKKRFTFWDRQFKLPNCRDWWKGHQPCSHLPPGGSGSQESERGRSLASWAGCWWGLDPPCHCQTGRRCPFHQIHLRRRRIKTQRAQFRFSPRADAVPLFPNVPGFMGLKLMSMGSDVLVLTCTMAEVGNTRMCVQDVSWGVLSCDVCMLSVVLRPNTDPVDTESGKMEEDLRVSWRTYEPQRALGKPRLGVPLPGMMTKEPWGSIATRQALRMLGVSAAEMPHIRHVSFRRLLRDCRFLLLSRMLQSGTRTQRDVNKLHDCAFFTRCRGKCARVYLSARRGPFYRAARWPPSTAETWLAPGRDTTPTASANPLAWPSRFSCEPCDRHNTCATSETLWSADHRVDAAGLMKARTCWAHRYWWCRSPAALRVGRCRTPAASAGRGTGSSPQKGRCTSGRPRRMSLRALSACLSREPKWTVAYTDADIQASAHGGGWERSEIQEHHVSLPKVKPVGM